MQNLSLLRRQNKTGISCQAQKIVILRGQVVGVSADERLQSLLDSQMHEEETMPSIPSLEEVAGHFPIFNSPSAPVGNLLSNIHHSQPSLTTLIIPHPRPVVKPDTIAGG